MIVDSKLDTIANSETLVGDFVDNYRVGSTSRRLSLRSILLLFCALELLPAFINFARGLSSPFFSPANINQHVYHHIHFLVYGFPIGLLVWIIMNRRIRELERRLSKLSPAEIRQQELMVTRRLSCWLPQLTLLIAFWIGWDDLKYHYMSKYWSLIHEILHFLGH